MKKFTLIYVVLAIVIAFVIAVGPVLKLDYDKIGKSIKEFISSFKISVTFEDRCNDFGDYVKKEFEYDYYYIIPKVEDYLKNHHLYSQVLFIYSSSKAKEPEKYSKYRMYVVVDEITRTRYLYAVNGLDGTSSSKMISRFNLNISSVNENSSSKFNTAVASTVMGDARAVCNDIRKSLKGEYVCFSESGEFIS